MILSRNRIMELVRKDGEKEKSMPLYDAAKLNAYDMRLEMDRDNGNYYYLIPMSSLVGKDVDENLISDYDWKYSKENDAITFFID